MATNSVDFPTWFNLGCYGGLACCMVAIAINTLYTSLRRRGTTRQLTGAIVTCVISALLLLPAFVWYNARFNAEQAALATAIKRHRRILPFHAAASLDRLGRYSKAV